VTEDKQNLAGVGFLFGDYGQVLLSGELKRPFCVG
jgi:hypothetical protein